MPHDVFSLVILVVDDDATQALARALRDRVELLPVECGHVTAYVPKPWTPAQVSSALEHAGGALAPAPRASTSTVLEWGPFRIDLPAQRVWVSGRELHDLEPLQVRVLGCLIERAGVVWHRDELCARLYSQGAVNSRALSRAVWGLRQRCDEARRLIVSVRAVGYGLGVMSHVSDESSA